MGFLDSLFGGGKKDNAAALESQRIQKQIRDAEDTRINQVRGGQTAIDQNFAQFDPAFFNSFQQAFLGTQLPQIDDQFRAAQGNLLAQLAGRGVEASTIAANRFADLQGARNDQQANAGNAAVDAGNALRGQIDENKGTLNALNTGAADPGAIAARQIGSNASLVAGAPSPVSSAFAAALQPITAFAKSDATSLNPRLPFNNFSASIGSRGSSVVNR